MGVRFVGGKHVRERLIASHDAIVSHLSSPGGRSAVSHTTGYEVASEPLRSQPSEDSGAMQIRANELLAEHVTQCAEDLRDLRPIGRC